MSKKVIILMMVVALVVVGYFYTRKPKRTLTPAAAVESVASAENRRAAELIAEQHLKAAKAKAGALGDVGTGGEFLAVEGNANTPLLVVIPSGSFMMGSSDNPEEGPVHEVSIQYKLAVGKYEVTFDEWDACVAEGGCIVKAGKAWDVGWGRGARPVISVGLKDAQEYLKWLNGKAGLEYGSENAYRLLSEAEWEYAARAGTSTGYWWGDKPSTDYANYDEESCCDASSRDLWVNTAPVGCFPANPFGLHDMHGNAWEWVEDGAHPDYKGAPNDGRVWRDDADKVARIKRGGSMNSFHTKPGISMIRSYFARTTARSIDPTGGLGLTSDGFRVARTLP